MTPVNQDFLESRPKGTVIQVATSAGHRFWLEAEGGSHRDFILHRGSVPRGFEGRVSRVGRPRHYWPILRLAAWVAEGRCAITQMEAGSR